MTKQKSIKHALLMSALAIIMCVSMLVGSTFAWFTDSVTSVGNKIQSGTLKLDLEVLDNDGNWTSIKNDQTALFNYEKWEPGYTEFKILKIVNEGSLALKWYAKFMSSQQLGELADVIDVFVCPSETTELTYPADRNLDGYTNVGTLRNFVSTIETTTRGQLDGGKSAYLGIALKMQETAGNEYQDKTLGAFDIMILATQNTVEDDTFDNQYDKDSNFPSIADKWDGTADFSLFGLPRNASADEIENAVLSEEKFAISTAEEFAAFADLVDAGQTFEGKTIMLNSDIDLASILLDPIGSYRNDKAFKGIFDGQGHTIKNLSQNTWELNNGYYYGDLGLGLFGAVEDAQIKNLNMDSASISGESALVGIVAATAYGDCTFENITVTNSNGADYQYYAGGIVGWASGNHRYINCDVDETTTIGSQWGDFNNASGGIIGGAGASATIYMKDCDVACRIDAVNDVVSAYQWHSYRRSGMLIGDSGQVDDPDGDNVGNAIAPNLTCENVTVTYGEWANYTYCEFAGTGYPYVRVQAGTSVDAYSNVRYGHPTDANGNKVVDDNHVHNDGEDHNLLIVFDQLYGGPTGDRYCTYGTATHDGVTVVYNNK